MDSPKEPQPTGEFKCQLCGLTAPYTYYGQKPPNTRSIEDNPSATAAPITPVNPLTPVQNLVVTPGESWMVAGRNVVCSIPKGSVSPA